MHLTLQPLIFSNRISNLLPRVSTSHRPRHPDPLATMLEGIFSHLLWASAMTVFEQPQILSIFRLQRLPLLWRVKEELAVAMLARRSVMRRMRYRILTAVDQRLFQLDAVRLAWCMIPTSMVECGCPRNCQLCWRPIFVLQTKGDAWRHRTSVGVT